MKNDIEQAEQVKRLWSRYGSGLLTIILIIIAIILARQWWDNQKYSKDIKAENSFIGLMNAANSYDDTKIDFYANRIISDDPKSIYSAISGLFLAKLEIDKKNPDKAAEFLKPIIKQKKGVISQTAALRLARIYLSQDKAANALKMLKESDVFDNSRHNADYQMILAQCYLKRNNTKEAREHLEIALRSIKDDQNSKTWIKMQLSNIDINKN